MRFFDNNTRNPDAYYEPNSLTARRKKSASPSRRCPCTATPTATTTATGTTTIRNPAICSASSALSRGSACSTTSPLQCKACRMRSKRRQVALFAKCDPAYGAGVAGALKLERAGEDRLKGTHAKYAAQEKSAAT